MKKLITLTAAALLTTIVAASPAPAVDIDTAAYDLVEALLYDAGCEKLPGDLAYDIVLELKKLPDATFDAATAKSQIALRRDGPTKFCARLKPHMDELIAYVTKETK